MKSSQGSLEDHEELEEPVYEEPVYEEVGAFPELTGDISTSFSTVPEQIAKPESSLTSQKSSDPPLLSKAGSLALEERPPELPPGPPSKNSSQAQMSLEEQLLQELSSLILRKGEATIGLGSPSQPSIAQPQSPSTLPTQTPGFPTSPPCTSGLPSSQPLT